MFLSSNHVADELASEPYFDIMTKYLPTNTEESELQQFLTFHPAFHQPGTPKPRLIERHPTIPCRRRMVTNNKRVIDPFDPDQVTGHDSICQSLASLSRKTTPLARQVLNPLFWEMSRLFPVETANFLLSVPGIPLDLKAYLSKPTRRRPEALQVELQNVPGMYEVFLEFLYSLRNPSAPNLPLWGGQRFDFTRLYLIKEISHHLSIIHRYAGASDEPISVAAHSVLCHRIAVYKLSQYRQYGHLDGIDYQRRLLAVFLHDAGEAYLNDQIGFIRDRDDVISIAEACILARVYSLFGIGNHLGSLTIADMEFVAEVDRAALAFELDETSRELLGFKCNLPRELVSTGNRDHFYLHAGHGRTSSLFRETLSSILNLSNVSDNDAS